MTELLRRPEIVGAVWEQRLVDALGELDDDLRPDADLILSACRAIDASLDPAVAEVTALVDAAGVTARLAGPTAGRQHHALLLDVDDVTAAETAAEALGAAGFERWERWERGAGASFRRFADHVTLARTSDHTLVVRLRWRSETRRSALTRAVTPTAGDWAMIDLPTWAWPAYSIVRAARLTGERLGLRRPHAASLGPFLATPQSLLDPLFDFAQLDAADVLVDLGAGDGRIAIASAERHGCRSLGIEHDAGLVATARQRAKEAGLAERVTFVEGDARDVHLAEATIVFAFLPVDVVADIFDDLFLGLSPGTRIVLHEQHRLPASLTPDVSEVIVGADAISVAHLWTVPDG